MSNTYKIKYYVNNDRDAAVHGKTIEMPIIPRVGDCVNLRVKISEKSSEASIYEVVKVFINQSGTKLGYDAQVNLFLN